MRVERIELAEWADALPESGFEVFHTPEALSVLDSHADGDLRLFAGYKGQHPVGLLPVFVGDGLLSTLVFSPPPGMNVPRLGPVLMPNSPKRRKQEKVNQRFTDAVLDAIEGTTPLALFRTVCNSSYADPRPFRWQNYDLDTKFTYVLDLAEETPADVFSSFSKSVRRDIRGAEELDVSIQRDGPDAAMEIYEQARDRYREQGRGFSLPKEYVAELVSELRIVDRARVYTARDGDGEFLTGITVLYSNDAGYYWLGGTRTVRDGVSLDSLLHWRIIEDIIADPPRPSVTRYDLMGANTQRLCQYKSEFAADLVPYYGIESSDRTMSLAKRTYQALVR